MSKDQNKSKKARFFNPPHVIKQKVGSGGIDMRLIEEAQVLIEKADFDFLPYARAFLADLTQALAAAKDSPAIDPEMKQAIVRPVMQLKANGGMFHYQLVSDVADIALQFLDHVKDLNADAFEVLQAHENTLKVIIKNNLRGDGGKEGYALVKELDKASKRYFTKYEKISTKREKRG